MAKYIIVIRLSIICAVSTRPVPLSMLRFWIYRCASSSECRKRARADMESAPTFLKRQSPLAEAVPRVELSPFVESEIRRGAFYMRPWRFALPQAGTGGYGIRPYVFL